MRARKAMMRRGDVEVLIRVVVCSLFALVFGGVVQGYAFAQFRNQSAMCNYVDVASQPIPILSAVVRTWVPEEINISPCWVKKVIEKAGGSDGHRVRRSCRTRGMEFARMTGWQHMDSRSTCSAEGDGR